MRGTRPRRKDSARLGWAYLVALLAGPLAVVSLAGLTSLELLPHWPGWRVVFFSMIAAPVLEEIIFRAGVQELLMQLSRAHIGPLTAANLATAVLFAAAHLWHHPPSWAAAVILPALVFGYFYERTHWLGAPIGLHVAYNTAYILLLVPR